MAQENRDDDKPVGAHQTDDASRSAAPKKKTVRRVVRQTPPEKPRVTLGRGLSASPGTEQQRTSVNRQSRQRRSQRTRSQQAHSQQAQSQRTLSGRKERSRSVTKTTFSAVSAASTRLAQRARTATGDAAGATRSRMGSAGSALVNATPKPAAAALVGLASGLLTVLIGWGFTYLFSWVRGTSTGGQTWGKITVVFMLIIAFAASEQLLRRMQVPHPPLTSLTGICVTLAVTLAFLLDFVAGIWAWLIIPAVAAASFAAMQALLSLADDYAKD